MKNNLFFVAAFAFLTECVTLSAQEAVPTAPAAPQPHLAVLGSNSVQLGTICGYGSTNVPFRIQNTGTAPLAIEQLISTCSCIKGVTSTNQIAPGETAVVTIILNVSAVHGDFKRGLWVQSSDPVTPRLLLSIAGNATPLFGGIPSDPFVLTADDANVSLTNRITLTASETNVFLGAPEIQLIGDVCGSVTIITNLKETARYELIAVCVPTNTGRQTMIVTLPVIGPHPAKPIVLNYKIVAGSSLEAAPSKLTVKTTSAEQTLRVILKGRTKDLDPAHLSWEPKHEGMNVSILSGRRGNSLVITIKLSPEAAAFLLKEKEPVLRFSYPNHKPTTIPLAKWSEPSE